VTQLILDPFAQQRHRDRQTCLLGQLRGQRDAVGEGDRRPPRGL
jgi:hypothetical protein